MADHRSLVAWQAARAASGLALRIFRESRRVAPFRVLDQLCGSTLSVQLNIAEGYALGTRPQFVRHLSIAFGSAIETEDLLVTILEEKVIPVEPGQRALEECRRSKRALLGLLRKLRPFDGGMPGDEKGKKGKKRS